jgi:hypothetical protein
LKISSRLGEHFKENIFMKNMLGVDSGNQEEAKERENVTRFKPLLKLIVE